MILDPHKKWANYLRKPYVVQKTTIVENKEESKVKKYEFEKESLSKYRAEFRNLNLSYLLGLSGTIPTQSKYAAYTCMNKTYFLASPLWYILPHFEHTNKVRIDKFW